MTWIWTPEQERLIDILRLTRWQVREAQADVAATASPKSAAVSARTSETTERPSPPTTEWSWPALRARVQACQQCSLCETRTQTVFGVGCEQADVMIVGEAPGAEEDARGEPFVGRAGQLLNAMLLSIGLEREAVFIANVLKCRPPRNRDPRPEEIAACRGYLDAQIAKVQPILILALGRIAAQALLQVSDPVGRMRGHWHNYAGIPLRVSYHPAYLLRSPPQKSKAYADLLACVERLKAVTPS